MSSRQNPIKERIPTELDKLRDAGAENVRMRLVELVRLGTIKPSEAARCYRAAFGIPTVVVEGSPNEVETAIPRKPIGPHQLPRLESHQLESETLEPPSSDHWIDSLLNFLLAFSLTFTLAFFIYLCLSG